MDELTKHYNKFNEDKRLLRRHGQVEYITTMQYIHQCLQQWESEKGSRPRMLDIGAGTGRYAVPLAEEGYDVTAIEYVKYNLGILKQKGSPVKAFQGDARKLKRFDDNSFDVTLLFGPMYHLYTEEDKLQALLEAKRVTVPGGYLLVAYLMNEYGVLTYGFKEGNVLTCLEDGRLDENFHCHSKEKDLYDYVRLEDIDRLRESAGLKQYKILSADGPADYMRRELNAMDEEVFATFLRYHLSTCERPELLGAGAHILQILRK
jgi:SAM-dependent methyltransferase